MFPGRILRSLVFLSAFLVAPAFAGTWYLDLSKAANRGFADQVEEDGLGGWTDQGPEGDLHDFPTGEQVFLGVPFQIIDPSKNDDHSAVILRGRRRPLWPESASISAEGRQAAWLYFLHTCAWAGTDKTRPFAQYEIRYRDGTQVVIPLRVGEEIAGWWGPGRGDDCLVAWTAKRKAAHVGVQLFAWQNPHPEKELESVVYRSLGRMPVPILLAVTGSSGPLSIQSPPEEAVLPEGAHWPAGPATIGMVPPVDVAAVCRPSAKATRLRPKAGASENIKVRQGRFQDAQGRPVKWMCAELPKEAWGWDDKAREECVARISACGFNMVRLPLDLPVGIATPPSWASWRVLWASHHLFLQVVFPPREVEAEGNSPSASAWETFWTTAPAGGGPAPKDDPVLALAAVSAAGAEDAAAIAAEFRQWGVTVPLAAEPSAEAADPGEVSRSLDYCEGDFTWDEPKKGKDGMVRFSGQSLVTSPEECPVARAALSRQVGKPFLAFAGEGWPNAYACEGPVLAAVTGSFQDWDGLIVRAFTGRWDGALSAANPAAALWPAAAVLFRRSDIAAASRTGTLGADGEDVSEETGLNIGKWAHRLFSGNGKAVMPASQVDSKLRKVVADNGRWEWQGNIGVFKAGSPRSQVLAGFLSHRPLGNYAWNVETPNLFTVFVLTSLTDDPTYLSRSLLVTAAARFEEQGAQFNGSRTALLRPGSDIALFEPLNARVTLTRSHADAHMTAKAYDASGVKLKTLVPLTWKGKTLFFRWPAGVSWVLLESPLPVKR